MIQETLLSIILGVTIATLFLLIIFLTGEFLMSLGKAEETMEELEANAMAYPPKCCKCATLPAKRPKHYSEK